jgi:hypothetical protein
MLVLVWQLRLLLLALYWVGDSSPHFGAVSTLSRSLSLNLWIFPLNYRFVLQQLLLHSEHLHTFDA